MYLYVHMYIYMYIYTYIFREIYNKYFVTHSEKFQSITIMGCSSSCFS